MKNHITQGLPDTTEGLISRLEAIDVRGIGARERDILLAMLAEDLEFNRDVTLKSVRSAYTHAKKRWQRDDDALFFEGALPARNQSE